MSSFNQQILPLLKSSWPPRVVSAIILLLFAWWAVANVLTYFEEKEIIPITKNIAQKVKSPTESSLNDLNLFGTAKKGKAANKTNEAKETTLKLTLRGILATDNPKQGIAQIQNDKKEEKHFAVNDIVFGNATLEEVYADRVILLHNEKFETLYLPEEFLNVKHFSVENRKAEMKKVATNYRDIFIAGRGSALRKLFGFDTAWKNGGFVGFVVKALGDKGKEMLDILGVQDGDIIVVVNGLRFSESLEASQQLTELKSATSVDVVIDRNGEEIPFHFDFDTPIIDKIAMDSSFVPDPWEGSGAEAPTENNFSPDINAPNNNSSSNASGTSTSLSGNPGSSPTSLSGNTGYEDSDEELGVDWDESEAGQQYIINQQNRTTGPSAPIKYDH